MSPALAGALGSQHLSSCYRSREDSPAYTDSVCFWKGLVGSQGTNGIHIWILGTMLGQVHADRDSAGPS